MCVDEVDDVAEALGSGVSGPFSQARNWAVDIEPARFTFNKLPLFGSMRKN